MGLLKKMFSGPTKEEIEKDITRKEIEISDLRKKIAQKQEEVINWMKCFKSDPTPAKTTIKQCESRISRLEDEITDLKKKLLRM